MRIRILAASLIVTTMVLGSTIQALSNEQRRLFNSGIYWYDINAATCELATSSSYTATEGAKAAFDYFVGKRKLSREQSAGIVGNLMVETGGTMDPSVEQGFVNKGFDPYAETGYGLAQWTSQGRKLLLQAYAEATNRAIDSFDMQLDFIWFELTGKEPVAGVRGGNEAGAYTKFITTSTTEDAAVSFARYYERNQLSIDYNEGKITYNQAFSERIGAAENAYSSFA